MTYTPAILSELGISIFLDTNMATTPEEAAFLWSWAVEHKRAGVSDYEAVWWFWQSIAARNPDLMAGYLKIKPAIIRRRCKSFYPNAVDYMLKISEAQYRQAVMGEWK